MTNYSPPCGEEVAQDLAEAMKWFRRAADQGHREAQYSLSFLLENYGVPKNPAEVVKWLRKAADQGHPLAQENLAVKYYHGEGVEKDFAEAAKWFGKAADQGNEGSQLMLGKMYSKGEGVPQNNILAHKWLSLSAAHPLSSYAEEVRDNVAAAMTPAQLAEAQRLVREWNQSNEDFFKGGKYLFGIDVTLDSKEAVKWFRLAADKGNTKAPSLLGAIFHDGPEGVAKDYREAAKWYRLAAEKGDADAERALGRFFL
jgi:TPR repeat protein